MEKSHCESLLQSLSEYIDGSLNPNLCHELEEHLATCQNCQIVYNTTLKTIDLYRVEEACEELPGEVRQRLFARLNLLENSPAENPTDSPGKTMPEIISAEIADQVKPVFADLTYPVSILLFIKKEDCPYGEETRQLLEEVAGFSPLLALTTYDLDENAALAQAYKIDKAPGFVILGKEGERLVDYGIRYFGFPAGHEFTSLINDLVMVAARNSALKEESRIQLKKLTKPMLIQVFVTPACAFCPQMVVLAHQLAFECPAIEAEMIEATEFFELANSYEVQGVPHTVFNRGAATMIGAFPEEKVIAELLKLNDLTGDELPKE